MNLQLFKVKHSLGWSLITQQQTTVMKWLLKLFHQSTPKAQETKPWGQALWSNSTDTNSYVFLIKKSHTVYNELKYTPQIPPPDILTFLETEAMEDVLPSHWLAFLLYLLFVFQRQSHTPLWYWVFGPPSLFLAPPLPGYRLVAVNPNSPLSNDHISISN